MGPRQNPGAQVQRSDTRIPARRELVVEVEEVEVVEDWSWGGAVLAKAHWAPGRRAAAAARACASHGREAVVRSKRID